MKSVRIAAIAALDIALSGCATIVDGSHQSVSVTTTPEEGAVCTLTNSQGSWFLTSPGSVDVHKTKTDLKITCKKDGFKDGTQTAISTFGGMTFGNILAGGIIGVGVDAASGANYYYPSPITVPLGEPHNAAASPAPAQVAPAQPSS